MITPQQKKILDTNSTTKIRSLIKQKSEKFFQMSRFKYTDGEGAKKIKDELNIEITELQQYLEKRIKEAKRK